MKVDVIQTIVGPIETILCNVENRMGELEIRGRTETIHTTVLATSKRILRRVLVC